MDIKRINPAEAKKLMDEEGYVLVDVRSTSEYATEHAEGAFNIPFLHKTPQGMVPNPDFARVLKAKFPDKQSKLITACQMGGRSLRAAAELRNLGYAAVVDMRGGFGGERDDAGMVVNVGWKDSKLPCELGEASSRAYAAIENEVRVEAQSASHGSEHGQGESGNGHTHDHGHSHGHSHSHGHGHGHSHGHGHGHSHEETSHTGGAMLNEMGDGLNRFASSKRMVFCARLKRELPGLKRRPFPGPVGERIFKEISAQAWDVWVEHQKMLVNEYKIRSDDAAALKLLVDQCEKFFFGDGVALPEAYSPEGAHHSH